MGGVFVSTLSQTAFLFTLIIVGYILAKFKFIPSTSAAVISKLERSSNPNKLFKQLSAV